jgi:hypothetical protein
MTDQKKLEQLQAELAHACAMNEELRRTVHRLGLSVVEYQRYTNDKLPDRRERIATAALQGMLANSRDWAECGPNTLAQIATDHADTLIAWLDSPQPNKPEEP